MKNLTYEQRLIELALESLEMRRLKADLVCVYKIIFGLLDVDSSDFFSLRCNVNRRGHRYVLYLPTCKSNSRFRFFTYRIINAWNALPPNTDFSSLRKFKASLEPRLLTRFCKVNFL